MIPGFNISGLTQKDLLESIEWMAELGYGSVAITLDRDCLDPYGDVHVFYRQVDGLRRIFDKHELKSVVETDSEFLLDRQQRHEPTLMTADPRERARRISFLTDAVDIAKLLGSDCVSVCSGALQDGIADDEAFGRLVSGLEVVLNYADQEGVTLGFEPKSGMFVDKADRYAQLLQWIDSPNLRLSLDVGDQGDEPVLDAIGRWGHRLVSVKIEDARTDAGNPFGFSCGDEQITQIMEALKRAGFEGGMHVKMADQSDRRAEAARRALEALSLLVQDG